MEPYRFLPSERIAVTIEEFLEGCRAEPMLAADQLHQGYFEPWLRDASARTWLTPPPRSDRPTSLQGQRWSSSCRQSR